MQASAYYLRIQSVEIDKKRIVGLIILFVFWPFGAFLISLVNFYRKESKIIFVLFTAVFGYSMIAEDSTMDLYRLLNSLSSFADLSFSQFIKSLFSHEKTAHSESIDFYRDLVSFFVARISLNGKLLMMTFGAVSGYVFSKSILVFEIPGSKYKLHSLIPIFCFSFIIGIDQLAGVRFSLAAYLFFFGTMKFLETRENKYLFIASLSVLVHFSFMLLTIMFILFLLIKKFPLVLYLLLLISFILPNIFRLYILQYSGFFGEAVEARTKLYYDLNTDLSNVAGTVWYIKYRVTVMMVFAYFSLIVFLFRLKSLKLSGPTHELFLLTIIILVIVNFTQNIPHLGYRFQFVFLMFFLLLLFRIYIQNPENRLIRFLTLLSFPACSLTIAYGVRSVLYYTTEMLYVGSLPMIFTDESKLSVWTNLFK